MSDRLRKKTNCAAVQCLTAGKDYLPAWASSAEEGHPNYRKNPAFRISSLNCFDDKFLLRIVVNSSENRCNFLCLLGTDDHKFCVTKKKNLMQ